MVMVPPETILMAEREAADRAEARRGWRMAEQYFRYADLEIETKPNNDGYVATIKLGFKTRRVFFDPSGRITHVLNLNAAADRLPTPQERLDAGTKQATT